jgi:hypothetical protein
MDARDFVEGPGEEGQRTRLAGELDLAAAEWEGGLVVVEVGGDVPGEADPSELVVLVEAPGLAA